MGAARVTRDRDRARAVLVLAVFMEAPARGMLRRPIGLLASTTTRADRAPEVMGNVAVMGLPEEFSI